MRYKELMFPALAAAMLAAPIGTAHASLILLGQSGSTAFGFGSTPTILTVDQQAQNTTEQGCNTASTLGSFSAADHIINGTTTGGNYCTEGGANDVPNGTQKTGNPTLASSSISNVSQVGVILNLNQVNTQGITVNGLVLSFYSGLNNNVIYSASLPSGFCTLAAYCSGANTFSSSVAGQGGAGFIFGLDATQQSQLAAAMATAGVNFSTTYVGGAMSLGCSGTPGPDCQISNDGAESMSLTGVTATPEPSSMILMATGILGMGGFVRRRRRQS